MVFLIDRCKMKSKRQSKNKASNKVIEIDMMRIDPGGIGFTSGFSSIDILQWVSKLLLSN